jgi:aryl-alcohol dehydrogenase-like predicted oxidoreductase
MPERLNRDVIDFYQLHSARLKHLQEGECIETMQSLRRQGKIRYWGLSLNTFEPEPEADYLITNNVANGFQLVLNILNQKALPLLQKSKKAGCGVIARMPLQFGLLTGKFGPESSFASNDHRNKRLTPAIISSALQELQPIWKLCDKYDITPAQLALSYILSYPEVSTVIPGIRTPEHVDQNTKGLTRLNEGDMKWIERLGQTDLAPLLDMIRQQG